MTGNYRTVRTGSSAVAALSFAMALLAAAVAVAGFKPADHYPVGERPVEVVTGDLNRDGKSDLVVSNSVSNTFSLLRGKGNGRFRPAIDFRAAPAHIAGGALGIAIGDFNRDGKRDLAVANGVAQRVSIVLAKQDGFAAPVFYPAGRYAVFVVAGRFTGDRWLDLAVSNSDDDSVSILRGGPNGQFTPAGDVSVGHHPRRLVTGHFNGDRNLDLAVGGVWRRTGRDPARQGRRDLQGSARLQGRTSKRHRGGAISYADRRPDLAVTNYAGDKVSILLGKSGARFGHRRFYPAGKSPAGIVTLNYNHDGRPDLAIADFAKDGQVKVLKGMGGGKFKPAARFGVGKGPYGIARGRFNGDRRQDLATADANGGTASVLIQK